METIEYHFSAEPANGRFGFSGITKSYTEADSWVEEYTKRNQPWKLCKHVVTVMSQNTPEMNFKSFSQESS